MRHLLPLTVAALLFAGCQIPTMTAQVGYARLAVDGDIGYVSGSSSGSISQDVESAFGLGDSQGSPYGRAVLDTGVQVLSVSAFALSDEGTGVLEANFGDSGLLLANTPVRSKLDLFNVKAAYAFEIPIGPVSISPGIALDYFDLDLEVSDLIGITTERVELNAPLPLAFLRAEAAFGPVSAVAEVGYIEADVEDVTAKFLDVEAMLAVQPTLLLQLFVGYRSLHLDASGTIDGDAFDADLRISGLLIGGGVRF